MLCNKIVVARFPGFHRMDVIGSSLNALPGTVQPVFYRLAYSIKIL